MYICSLSNENSLNFKSRNAKIRFADNIARRVNIVCPHYSPSMVKDRTVGREFPNLVRLLNTKITRLRSAIDFRTTSSTNKKDEIFAIISGIKDYKCANCFECAELSAIFAKANGIKNYHFAEIVSNKDKKICDHFVLLVEDKKPYIIDSWLGFADYVPNALKRFQIDYAKYLDNPDTIRKTNYRLEVLDKIPEYNLQEWFPELICKSQQKNVLNSK